MGKLQRLYEDDNLEELLDEISKLIERVHIFSSHGEWKNNCIDAEDVLFALFGLGDIVSEELEIKYEEEEDDEDFDCEDCDDCDDCCECCFDTDDEDYRIEWYC